MEDTGGESAAASADAEFVAREDLILIIMELGFSRNAAIKSLFYTGNYNAELAAGWLFENNDKNLDGPHGPFEDDGSDEEGDMALAGVAMYKMVLVVNGELGMGVGKVAAQTAHAALGLYRKLIEEQIKYAELLISWEQFGETKIVVRGDNTAHLVHLATKCEAMELPTYTVHDAGRTQIAAGSMTVLAIIGKLETVDEITGKLKLL